MEFPVAALLAYNPIQPVVDVLHAVLTFIYGAVHNYGWALILLAALVKGLFWPLNTMQFKAMLKTQQLAPKINALKVRYKNDREKLNAETMALYKESGANPLAGCAPILLQMPILISLYWAVISDKALFASQTWGWIGSPVALASPYHILAANLASVDYVLLALYVVSMYFSVRFTSPPSPDPAQAQQQKIMAFVSPAMVGYLGIKFAWPSALIIYWLSFNVFTMAQQFYLIRKYHTNPSAIGPHPEKALEAAAGNGVVAGTVIKTTSLAETAAPPSSGGSRSARRRRSSRR